MQPPIHLVTIGEAMLRLSVGPGDRLEDAPAYDVHIGGAEANVAYAAARVGVRSAWMSALPDNPLGRRLATTLGAGGVDTSFVRWVEGGRLGLYFVELGAAPHPISVTYDRAGSAMARATPDDFDWSALAGARHLHLSGITLALSASCREVAHRAMREARDRGATVSLDVNYRQKLWDRPTAAAAVRGVAPMVDILVCTMEDARDVFDVDGPPEQAGERMRSDLQIDTVVLTLGADGAIALRKGATIRRGGHPVEVVDRVGAGDAFVAGLIWGLAEDSLELGMERGLAMSALKIGLRGDLFRFGAADVNPLLARAGREVGR